VVGLLTRSDIARGLATVGPAAYVAEMMNRSPKTSRPEVPLETAMEFFQGNDSAPVLILGDGGLEGILTSENFSEFVMLEAARLQGRRS
jgi:CBS domain-containing protein